jgi:hypothetical protein
MRGTQSSRQEKGKGAKRAAPDDWIRGVLAVWCEIARETSAKHAAKSKMAG